MVPGALFTTLRLATNWLNKLVLQYSRLEVLVRVPGLRRFDHYFARGSLSQKWSWHFRRALDT